MSTSEFASLAPDGKTIFWYQTGGKIRTQEEAQKTAERKRKSEEKNLPLFAPVIEQVSSRLKTADEIIDEDKTRWNEMARAELQAYERGQMLRNLVKGLVSEERFAELENHRFTFLPKTVEYSCNFWYQQLKDLDPALAAKHNALRSQRIEDL